MPEVDTILIILLATTGLVISNMLINQQDIQRHKDRIIESKNEEITSLMETNLKLYLATVALKEERSDGDGYSQRP